MSETHVIKSRQGRRSVSGASHGQLRSLTGAACLFALCLGLLGPLCAAPAQALPVSMEQARKGAHLAESALYYVDEASELGVEQAGSPLMQSNYSRLSDGIPLTSAGILWLKFSLLPENSTASGPLNHDRGAGGNVDAQAGNADRGVALSLPYDSPAGKVFVPLEVTPSGHVRKWRQVQPNNAGNFPLPVPRGVSMPVFVQLSGIPGLWFNPELVAQNSAPGEADLSVETVFSTSFVTSHLPLALQVILIFTLAICLARGLFGHDEWRVWASAVVGCVLVQAVFLRQGTNPGAVYLAALPGLLAPGLAIMLVPHLGRHLLQSKNSKALDYSLVILSLPGVATALLPLIPGLSWTAKLLPLAPLLLLPLLIPAAAALLQGRRGSFTFMLLCLLPLFGALLALVGFGLAIFQGQSAQFLFRNGAWLTLCGYTAASLLLALSFPSATKKDKKNDFFPLGSNDLHNEPESDDTFGAPEAFTTDDELSLHPLRSRPRQSEPVGKPAAAPLGTPSLEDVFGPGSNDTGPEIDGHDKSFPDISFPEPKRGVLPGLEGLTGHAKLDAAGAKNAGQNPEHSSLRADSGDPFSDMLESTGGISSADMSQDEPLGETQGSLYPDEAKLGALSRLPCDARLHEPETCSEPAGTAEISAGPGESATQAFKGGEDLIYIKDSEEPGLVIIKPRHSHERESGTQSAEVTRHISGGVPMRHTPAVSAFSGPDHAAGRNGQTDRNSIPQDSVFAVSSQEETLELRGNIEELKRQQSNAADLSDNLEQVLHGLGLALTNLDRLAQSEGSESPGTRSIFNLANLVRKVHAETLPIAEHKGVTLSWFVAPTLPLLYKGEEDSIRNALAYMLRGAVESADAGAVQLAVRQSPEGGEGIIRFTLVDSSMNPNSTRRPARLLSRAWELARASQGAFSIEFIPKQGTYIHFSLRLQPLIDDDDAWYGASADKQSSDRPATLQQAAAHTVMAAFQAYGDGPDYVAPPSGQPDSHPDGNGQPVLAASELVDTPGLPEDDFPLPEERSAETSDGVGADAAESAMQRGTSVVNANLEEAGEAVQNGEEPLELPLATIVQSSRFDASAPDGTPTEKATPAGEPAAIENRSTIVIADMAASGRRFIARRLTGLPYQHFEAKNAREIVRACAAHNVALIILDADMPENEVMQTLEEVNATENAMGWPPVPSLCLIAHNSQAERMRRLGCTECQVKSAGRSDFQTLVLNMAPRHTDIGIISQEVGLVIPEDTIGHFEESLTTSPTRASESEPVAESERQAPTLEEPYLPEKETATGGTKKKKRGKPVIPDRSVPMLDLIVSSLDNETLEMSQSAEEHAGGEAPGSEARTEASADSRSSQATAPGALTQDKNLTRLSGAAPGTSEEYMDTDMVPLIPGFLEVLKESLFDLARGVNSRDAAIVQEIASRMCGQGKTFGLNNLERMAACVERAAAAEDQEAISDLAEELLNLGNRYLLTLRLTHDDYVKSDG